MASMTLQRHPHRTLSTASVRGVSVEHENERPFLADHGFLGLALKVRALMVFSDPCLLWCRASMEPIFCPKPRRLSHLCGADPARPLRWHLGHQIDPCDSTPGADVLDTILSKGSHGGRGEQHNVASSPPYFCGSPPSRAANPLVLDARFGEEKAAPLNPLPALAVPSPGARQGRVRASFGPKPAAVRIEGFDCLSGDGRRGSCGITAMA